MSVDYGAVLSRMKENIAVEFPIGCRVEMSADGLKQFPEYIGRKGTVVAYSKEISPKVLWDGRKTASGYAPWFVQRISEPHP